MSGPALVAISPRWPPRGEHALGMLLAPGMVRIRRMSPAHHGRRIGLHRKKPAALVRPRGQKRHGVWEAVYLLRDCHLPLVCETVAAADARDSTFCGAKFYSHLRETELP